MTREQLIEIIDKLKEWREERQLTYEKQAAGLIANLLEECVEYLRAKDDEERIDALCDILTFSLNSCPEFSRFMIEQPDLLDLDIKSIIRFINNIIESTEEDKKGWLEDIIAQCIYLIKFSGYNPYECMLETIKEISSRTGEYNETIKKFVKYQGAYNDFEANEMIRKLDENFQILRETETHWYYGIKKEMNYGTDSRSIVKDYEQGQLVKWYRADYSKCKR